MKINAEFFDSPDKKFSLSVRAIKQLTSEAKIKRAKNAVRRKMLSGAYLKCDDIDGSLRNPRQRAIVYVPSVSI